MNHAPLNATLIERQDLDDRHTIFRVLPDEPLAFIPGQWTEMGLPRGEEAGIGPSGDEFVKDGIVRRAYSIASAPAEEPLEFFFNRVEGGQLTSWLWRLQPGDRLYVDPEARGHFTLEGLPEGRKLLFVGAGTGISPFVCLLRSRAATPPWGRAALLHGARNRALLAYEEELRELARSSEHIHYLPSLTRQPEGEPWEGLRGRLPGLLEDKAAIEARIGFPLDPSSCSAYLCGSTGMIQAVEDRLMAWGFQPRWLDPAGTIHTEIYY